MTTPTQRLRKIPGGRHLGGSNYAREAVPDTDDCNKSDGENAEAKAIKRGVSGSQISDVGPGQPIEIDGADSPSAVRR